MGHRTKIALVVVLAGSGLVASRAGAWFRLQRAAEQVQTAVAELIESTPEAQRAALVLPADSPKRTEWHFIPMDERKGVKLGDMTEKQREASHQLLQGLLSQLGYDKTQQIMQLESLLRQVEQGRGPIRDPLRYYVTLFGDPRRDSRWGISFEGHHLSLNFLLEGGKIVASTPQFFGSNPTVVKEETAGIAEGTRVLTREETLAFDLLNSLDATQRDQAVIAARAPRDIRAAGEPQPPGEEPAGIAASQLNDKQNEILWDLIREYAAAMRDEVAAERLEAITAAGRDKIHFAWAGALEPGVGHYYRIQGPTFLIEFVNTQPDAWGNPASHIHSVWRDMRGDFGIPIQN